MYSRPDCSCNEWMDAQGKDERARRDLQERRLETSGTKRERVDSDDSSDNAGTERVDGDREKRVAGANGKECMGRKTRAKTGLTRHQAVLCLDIKLGYARFRMGE